MFKYFPIINFGTRKFRPILQRSSVLPSDAFCVLLRKIVIFITITFTGSQSLTCLGCLPPGPASFDTTIVYNIFIILLSSPWSVLNWFKSHLASRSFRIKVKIIGLYIILKCLPPSILCSAGLCSRSFIFHHAH